MLATLENIQFITDMLNDYRRRVYAAIRNLSLDEIHWQPRQNSNSIGFIFWHVSRVEDQLVTWCIAHSEETWIKDKWYTKMQLPQHSTGLGYSSEDLAQFPKLTTILLSEYFDVVRQNTNDFLTSASPELLESVPRRTPFSNNPTASDYFKNFTVRRYFRQLIAEENQHLGQISYLRGLQKGMTS